VVKIPASSPLTSPMSRRQSSHLASAPGILPLGTDKGGGVLFGAARRPDRCAEQDGL